MSKKTTETENKYHSSKLELMAIECRTLSAEDQVPMMQHADDTLKELILILENNNEDRTKEEKQKVQDYVLKRNRLFRVINDGERERLLFVIPKSIRKSIVVKFHDLL
ncbi:hypothetical protein AVEN_70834-1 [Araneus ventricosus]|uniref:Uncharacterized protein n=1 Tax=Araneus ventricosus TaxID=182803 RepID=A0A4Y2GGA8_ARAVE|nr:hypothetical protein AVEN_70834-1 [Araneus ventricosus]